MNTPTIRTFKHAIEYLKKAQGQVDLHPDTDEPDAKLLAAFEPGRPCAAYGLAKDALRRCGSIEAAIASLKAQSGQPAAPVAQEPAAGSVRLTHVFYKTSDPDAPDAIRDRNGEVVLRLCKRCGKCEAELSEPCIAVAHLPEYSSAMGEAAETYLSSFKHAHPLPAQFRWNDLWTAMVSAAPVAAQAQPTWDDLQALAVKHGAWVPGYGPFAAELLATYGAAPKEQPHWVMNWLNAMNAVAAQSQPVGNDMEPLDYEHRHAIKEGERNDAEDKYFDARPEFDNKQDRRLFCDGFDRGYDRATARAARRQQS